MCISMRRQPNGWRKSIWREGKSWNLMNDHQEILPLARYDLACYAVAIWRGFELAAYHQLIVDRLENVERGEITRLMISLPPRHGKSLLASQIFPGWYLGRHPDREIISATYGQDLSDHFGRRVRNMVSDPLHQAIFPQFRLVNDAASMRQFSTTAGGSYYAVGRGGAITGRGADLLLIDDPLKDQEEEEQQQQRQQNPPSFDAAADSQDGSREQSDGSGEAGDA